MPTETVLPKLLARMLPHLPDALTVHEPDGRYRLVTPFMRTVTGWGPADLMGRSPYEFIHPDDMAMVQRKYHQAANAGACVRGRFRFRHRDDHYIWLDFTTAPLFDEESPVRTVTGHIALSRDVTAEVDAVHLSQAQASHLTLMQDLAGLAWWTLDLRTSAISHNEAFVELTGRAASTLDGGSGWRRLVHPADRPSLLRLWQRLRQGEQHASQTAELRLNRLGGGWRWVRITLGLQRLGASPTSHWLLHGVMLDIDEAVSRREQVNQWMRAQERLRLQERVATAHQLHDEVGQTLVGLKWQIETVLSQSGGQRGPVTVDPQLLRNWMGHIEEANGTLRRVAQRLRPSLPALGLRAAIHKLTEEFQQTWLQTVPIDVALDEDLPDGDEWRVEVALGMVRECLNNVARHAQATRVVVSAMAHAHGSVLLEIEDDGKGMNVAAAKAMGTKMGLTSLQERASQLDARLDIDAAPGKGTRVSICLRPHGDPQP